MKFGRFLVLSLAMAAIAYGQEGPGQRVGKALDQTVERIGEDTKEAATSVADHVREGFDAVRDKVDDLGVEDRIYSRLHWDKTFHDMQISVKVNGDGIATLRGMVPSASAKVKAEMLALDTVGVEGVVNELHVATFAQ